MVTYNESSIYKVKKITSQKSQHQNTLTFQMSPDRGCFTNHSEDAENNN